jgi:hypothetical protein
MELLLPPTQKPHCFGVPAQSDEPKIELPGADDILHSWKIAVSAPRFTHMGSEDY